MANFYPPRSNPDHPPPSPWAARYYPRTDPYWRFAGGTSHSGLAPEFPTLHPSNFHEEPPWNPIPKPSNPELDRLFYAERWQRFDLSGLMTWQIPSLATAPYGYAAQDPLPVPGEDWTWDKYYKERVVPNEQSWFPFFRKNRWFDLRTNGLETIQNPFPEVFDHDTNWWTVDNPIIWENLSVSIEIANRFLITMLNNRNTWFVTSSLLIAEEETAQSYMANMGFL
jgi:hypothetical protein